MASIERTAYPRFKRFMSVRELHVFYTPQPDEIVWAREVAGSDEHLLALVTQLKTFNRLGYFPVLDEVPPEVVGHIRRDLRLPDTTIRARANEGTFPTVLARLGDVGIARLERLLVVGGGGKSEFNQLKRPARRPSWSNFRAQLEHQRWVDELGDARVWWQGVPPSKIADFAGEAGAADAAVMGYYTPAKRVALLAALVFTAPATARDDTAETFCRRVGTLTKRSRDELEALKKQHQEITERLVSNYRSVLEHLDPDGSVGAQEQAALQALIEHHYLDVMRVVLSVQEGKISSATLLRRPSTYSRRNNFYKAFREIGRVIRTVQLLRFLSDPQLRRRTTAETNKVESYNRFSDWCRFGNHGVIAANDPEEQEKILKFSTLLTSAVIFHTTLDMMAAVRELIAEGWTITSEDLAVLSPYLTARIQRFGVYATDEITLTPDAYDAHLGVDLAEAG